MPCYLIHLYQPLAGHASHYLGYASNVARRYERHMAGNGSRMLAAAIQQRIDFDVVRVWKDGNKAKEKELKRGHNSKVYCPLCQKKGSK